MYRYVPTWKHTTYVSQIFTRDMYRHENNIHMYPRYRLDTWTDMKTIYIWIVDKYKRHVPDWKQSAYVLCFPIYTRDMYQHENILHMYPRYIPETCTDLYRHENNLHMYHRYIPETCTDMKTICIMNKY